MNKPNNPWAKPNVYRRISAQYTTKCFQLSDSFASVVY